MREARQKASEMIKFLNGRKAIFVGKAVAYAFEYPHGYFRWKEFGGFIAATIPLPSGVNHWWNDEINVARAKKFLSGILERAAWTRVIPFT